MEFEEIFLLECFCFQDIQVSIALPEPVMGVNMGVVSVARYFPKNVNATWVGGTSFMFLAFTPCLDPVRKFFNAWSRASTVHVQTTLTFATALRLMWEATVK